MEAVGLVACFPFADSSLDVGDRGLVDSASGDEDLVQCPVELAVAAATESVEDRLSGGGGNRGGAGEPGKRGLAAEPIFVGPPVPQSRNPRNHAGLGEAL